MNDFEKKLDKAIEEAEDSVLMKPLKIVKDETQRVVDELKGKLEEIVKFAEENKKILSIADIGIMASVCSVGSPDCVVLCGDAKTFKINIKALVEKSIEVLKKDVESNEESKDESEEEKTE